jgi:TonB family protein
MKAAAVCFICLGVAAWSVPARAADLNAVRELYATANYEEALKRLDAQGGEADVVDVERYRALCLVALGRTAEAESALERLILQRPLSASLEDVSPRVATLFETVRRRTLPAAARTSYDTAKRSFDRAEYAMAIAGFTTVLTILEDKALSAESGIGDLKQLAEGFSRLAGAELERSKAAAKAAAVPAPPPAAAIAAPAAAPIIYSVADAEVSPPVELERRMPPWNPPPALARMERRAMLTVTVDETGSVTSARLSGGILPAYDEELLAAARRWRFKPATRNGAPVKFAKVLEVVLKPQ